MPHVEITLVEGRTVEQKRRIAARVTDVLVEEAKTRKQEVTVAFIDVKKESFAHAGELVIDRKT